MLPCPNRYFFHITSNTLVSIVVVLDNFLRFLPADADALRQSPWLDGVGDSKVYDLSESSGFLQFLICPGAKHQSGCACMNVFSFLKSFKHHRILSDMGQQPQFELRVVCRNNLVALLSYEGAPDATAKITANGNILQIGIA